MLCTVHAPDWSGLQVPVELTGLCCKPQTCMLMDCWTAVVSLSAMLYEMSVALVMRSISMYVCLYVCVRLQLKGQGRSW